MAYNEPMQFLQKIAVRAAATLLVILLFSFGFGWSLHQVVGNSENVKRALDKSGIYQSVVAELLDRQQTDHPSSGTSTNNIPTDQPEVRKIIGNAFPPKFLQAQSEQVIDAAYARINGKTPTLQFTIDLSTAKIQLADGIGQYASARLASLPACAPGQMPGSDIDPLRATCLPMGLDTAAAAAKVRDDILNGDFLKDPIISANSIKTDDGKTLSQQFEGAPSAYRRAKLDLYGSGVLMLALAAVIVFLSTTWRVGVRKLAVVLITLGTISTVLGWLSSFAMQHAATKAASLHTTTDKALQQQGIAIAQSLIDNLRTWWMAYGLTLVVLGLGALLALHVVKPKKTNPLRAEPPVSSASIPASPEKPAEPPIAAKPPRRKA